MPKLTSALLSGEPDPALLDKVAIVKRVCLAVVVLTVAANLAAWFIPALGRLLPEGWQLMKAETALAALFSALSLQPSELRFARPVRPSSLWFAIPVLVLAATVLVEYCFHVSFGFDTPLPAGLRAPSLLAGRMSPQTAAAFALLGMALLFLRAQSRLAIQIADLFVSCLGFLVLILITEYLFGATPVFHLPMSLPTPPQPLFCLALLTIVAALCRAESGVFSIFLRRGISGRIARILGPLMLLVPLLRETLRASIVNSGRLPTHYATAILSSVAAIVAFSLVLFLAWRIHSMEMEIHDLSLRDELTGLYNLRGFKLLAGQALRMARRSMLPFTVLFIDLDNLKEINDTLGHRTGSQFLAETAEILRRTFRETDVVGRIGGDEFAVAGQFSPDGIALATSRLHEAAAEQTAKAARPLALSFSIGHVTSEEPARETLDELLAEADGAMYEEKRRKKLQLT